MRLVARAFVLVLMTGPLGCAALGAGNGTGGTGGEAPGLTVACTNNRSTEIFLVDWVLRVSPGPIESGKPFTATLDGVAVFDEGLLDAAQTAFTGGVKESNLVDLMATVHVRSGATGDDVVLRPEPIPYQCDFDRKACDLANDVIVSDDPFDAPGLRANTDCEPISKANPCGRFVLLPISSDCRPGGICASLGKLDQCANGFCITAGLPIDLQQATGHYTAGVEGNVLFGWDDESTGATVQEGGPNDGTWILPEADYFEPTGPNSFRATVLGVEAALECTMGVNCKDFGVGCQDILPSRTPDSELIAFPIQMEAP